MSLESNRGYYLFISLGLAGWIVLLFTIAPPFGGTDVYIFKDASCNLASGLGFSAFAIPGHLQYEPAFFGSYVPGLPLLYGLITSVFDCSITTNAVFELVISGVLTVFIAFLTLPFIASWGPLPKLAVAALFGASVPSGLIVAAPDRPEHLGTILFIVTMIVSGPKFHRRILGAFLAGFTFWFHPFIGFFSFCVVWFRCVALNKQHLGLRWSPRAISDSVQVLVIFLLPIALPAFFLWTYFPEIGDRFVEHASGSSLTIGIEASRSASYIQDIKHAALSSGFHSMMMFFSYCAVLVLVGTRALWPGLYNARENPYRLWYIVILSLSLLPIFLFPYQNNYIAFARTAVLILMLTGPPLATSKLFLLAVLLVVFVANIPVVGRDLLIRASYTEDFHNSAARITDQLNHINPDALLLVPVSHYHLVKQKHGNIANPEYVSQIKGSTELANAALVCRTGEERSRLGSKSRRDLSKYDGYRLIKHADPVPEPSVASLFKPNSYWGWYCDMYVKR